MNLVNRLLILLLALGFLAAGVLLAVSPALAERTVGEAAAGGLRAFQATTATERLGAGIILAAVGAILLVLELWPSRRARVVRSAFDGGVVEYDAEATASLLERDLARLEGVQRVMALVVPRSDRVDVLLRLHPLDSAAPRAVAERVASRARERVEREMGLQLGELRIGVAPPRGDHAVERREPARVTETA